MQTQNRFFDDLARIMGGAASGMTGLKDEFDNLVRGQMERMLGAMDLVTRDEFEAVQAMAANAREENAALEKRIDALENAAKPAKKAAKPPKSEDN